ncbi:MAG: SMC-Scp complex subunit ScpB [Opitutaceae bacterium]|nr:SMC-Scp complex subunit ScpB [Opitutaceae bacterium]
MAFDLVRVLRSLLFASPGSLSVKDVQAVFTRFHEEAATLPALTAEAGEAVESAEPPAEVAEVAINPLTVTPSEVPSLVTATQIREAMDAIRAQLESGNEVYCLQETHQGWRLVTTPDCAEWVRLLRNQPRPMKLSQSALETLAIIAYRQPVVRSEIESIRGVSVESAINRLTERELIKIVGRADLPGRPIQYGTTEQFLEFVGVKSLEELPASDVLSAREIDQWLQKANEQQQVSDSAVGLDTESGDEQADLELKAGGETEPPVQWSAPPTELGQAPAADAGAAPAAAESADAVKPTEPTP